MVPLCVKEGEGERQRQGERERETERERESMHAISSSTNRRFAPEL